jgi:hypothetical protein
MTRNIKFLVAGFIIGALVPLFWGILSLILFNLPQGRLSDAFWIAVHITCPAWLINGQKSLFLTPLLNGCLYALIALLITIGSRAATRPDVRRA